MLGESIRTRSRRGPSDSSYNGKFLEEIGLAEDKTYKAEYLGSGTFNISKPKRTKAKRRQTKLRNPQRGARK